MNCSSTTKKIQLDKNSVILYAEISGYCSLPGPSLANANDPASVDQTIWDTNSFTCAAGYISSGPTSPYFTCLAGDATAGVWSAPTYTCNRMPGIHDRMFFEL